MPRTFLGVDGGGTKTLAAICDATGRILGAGLGGASGIDSVGAQGAHVGIGEAVDAARRAAGLPAQPFTGVFLGMAGVVSSADQAVVHAVARGLSLGDVVGVDHDIRIALAGGLAGRPGIALIAGTGSACFGMNAQGERWQAGGWGHLISDEGSSYWFGCRALQLAMGAYDGRWLSSLEEPVRRRLGIASLSDIHQRLYAQEIAKAELAAFAPLVFEAAGAGDRMAQQAIGEGVAMLAALVEAVARRLGWGATACAVTLTGGLWRAGAPLLEPFRGALARLLPAAVIVEPELPPVVGACVLALQQAGITVDATVRQRLAAHEN